MFRVLALGDIVGRPGRRALSESLPKIIKDKSIDLVIANGENASGGSGLIPKNAEELFDAGIDVVTSGNHIWHQREFEETFVDYPMVLRPANYPEPCPGPGFAILERRSVNICVINLQGRVFMDAIDCPFKKVDEILSRIDDSISLIIVDFHAEVTSEKVAMGWYLDGRVGFIFGTHTHIPTADARILPEGMAYVTDLGMCGPRDSVIGMKKEPILRKFLTQRPHRFDVAKDDVIIQGIICEMDPETGKASSIERVVYEI